MNLELRKHTVKVVEKYNLSSNTFFMKLESEEEISPQRAMYHIRIYDDQLNFKPYSPLYISKKQIALAIKTYPGAKITKYLNEKKVNDFITVSEPILGRECKLNEFKNALMIAGGTGITPMYQLLREHVLSGMNTTGFTLLFLNKTPEDAFLAKELEVLKTKSNDKIQIIYIFSQGTDSPDNQHISGRLTKDMLLTVTKSKIFEFVYICGPASLYETFSGGKNISSNGLQGVLKEIGYTEKDVYTL
ncbi:NADH-cytochrome b5 reductase [Glugoides intestinalis]